jgi:hypothetical protein
LSTPRFASLADPNGHAPGPRRRCPGEWRDSPRGRPDDEIGSPPPRAVRQLDRERCRWHHTHSRRERLRSVGRNNLSHHHDDSCHQPHKRAERNEATPVVRMEPNGALGALSRRRRRGGRRRKLRAVSPNEATTSFDALRSGNVARGPQCGSPNEATPPRAKRTQRRPGQAASTLRPMSLERCLKRRRAKRSRQRPAQAASTPRLGRKRHRRGNGDNPPTRFPLRPIVRGPHRSNPLVA